MKKTLYQQEEAMLRESRRLLSGLQTKILASKNALRKEKEEQEQIQEQLESR